MRWPSGAQRPRRRAVQPEPERAARGAAAARGRDARRPCRRRASRQPLELGQLAGLDQAEVALGQLESRARRQAAQHRLGEAVVAGAAQQRRVTLAGDPVEDDAGDLDVVAMAGEALDQRRGRGAHAGARRPPEPPAGRAGSRGRRSSRVPSAAPSNSPITPSPSTRSTPLDQPHRRARPGSRSASPRLSRLRHGRPDARAWNAGSM